jgi:hypothetical protein
VMKVSSFKDSMRFIHTIILPSPHTWQNLCGRACYNLLIPLILRIFLSMPPFYNFKYLVTGDKRQLFMTKDICILKLISSWSLYILRPCQRKIWP